MSATTENQNALPVTLNTPKSPANVTSSPIVKGSGVTSEDENKRKPCILSQVTTPTGFKQASSGLEEFLLLRKGKQDSWKSSSHPHCTPTSKKQPLFTDVSPVFSKPPENVDGQVYNKITLVFMPVVWGPVQKSYL